MDDCFIHRGKARVKKDPAVKASGFLRNGYTMNLRRDGKGLLTRTPIWRIIEKHIEELPTNGE